MSAFPVVSLRTVTLDAQTGPFGSQFHFDEYVDGGIPVINPSNIIDGKMVPDPTITVTKTTSERLARHRLEPGDLVFARRGELGRAAVVSYEGAGWLCGTGSLRIRPQQNALIGRFAKYVLQGVSTRAYFEMNAVGSTMANLNTAIVLGLPVPLPSPKTQGIIADFLDAETARIDRMIEIRCKSRSLVAEKISSSIAKLATVGTGRIQRTRDPWIPWTGEGWEVISLKRRWRIIDCKHRTPTYVQEGYPVISPGDISPGRLDPSVAHRFVDEEDYRDLADHLRRAQRGDIVYGRNASVGVAAFVDTTKKFTMGQDVCRITSVDQNQLFLTYFLNTAAKAQLGSLQIGSTFTRVNIGTLLELSVACPPPEEQRILAAEMDLINQDGASLIQSIDRQLDLLAERRQALITAAVTGEIAV